MNRPARNEPAASQKNSDQPIRKTGPVKIPNRVIEKKENPKVIKNNRQDTYREPIE